MEKLDSNLPEFSVEGIPSCNEEGVVVLFVLFKAMMIRAVSVATELAVVICFL